MTWLRTRCLPMAYLAVLATLIVVGCTSKQDPSEVLPLCGNHSCGSLVMVTTDTSSDGYHYLNPRLSPDGTRIAFTCDWWALPSDPRYAGDDYFVNYRQIGVIPVGEGVEPVSSISELGAELVKVQDMSIPISGVQDYQQGIVNFDKGGPTWLDDNNLVFPIRVRVGFRLFRADITTLEATTLTPLLLERTDANASPSLWQHMEPTLSPDGRWLAFTRSGCAIPDSFETCSGVALWLLDMATAEANSGYDAVAFPVTAEYSRIETPAWSPDGSKIVFSGGMDVAGGRGVGTELFTVDVDTTGLAAHTMALDHNLRRLTNTVMSPGDPIVGILNTSPCYSADGSQVYFVSTRRAPSITLHDRNIWRVAASGALDPEIYFFTRADEADPTVYPDGSMLMSSALGFPTEMLNRLEEESYQRIKQDNEDNNRGLDEVQMRAAAADERRQLEFFEGVMSHMYIYRP
jgi:Tol biopolymer transport system component